MNSLYEITGYAEYSRRWDREHKDGKMSNELTNYQKGFLAGHLGECVSKINQRLNALKDLSEIAVLKDRKNTMENIIRVIKEINIHEL